MTTKLTKEELFKKAQERFNSWAKMYSDPNVSVQQMYDDMSSSCYSGCMKDDFKIDSKPVLDETLCFRYKGYQFELSSCNFISCKEQMLGLTKENFKERFPHGVFTDRYVCWMYGHKDYEGHTKEEVDEPEYWAPVIYLVPGAWSWGAYDDLNPGGEVSTIILEMIDKFLETFKE